MILAQQNAGNIQYLKSRMDDVTNVKDDVDKMKQDIQTMQVQVDGLVQQQADMASELSGGGEPMNVDGLDEGEEEGVTHTEGAQPKEGEEGGEEEEKVRAIMDKLGRFNAAKVIFYDGKRSSLVYFKTGR